MLSLNRRETKQGNMRPCQNYISHDNLWYHLPVLCIQRRAKSESSLAKSAKIM